MAKSETVLDAYVDQDERVLDPTILEQSALDRMPQPTGWRMLVLPYGGKKTSDGGILLTKNHRQRSPGNSGCLCRQTRSFMLRRQR